MKTNLNNNYQPNFQAKISPTFENFLRNHFNNGSTLKIRVKKIMDDGAIASFDGEIFSNDQALASGRVNLIRVTDNDLERLFKRD